MIQNTEKERLAEARHRRPSNERINRRKQRRGGDDILGEEMSTGEMI